MNFGLCERIRVGFPMPHLRPKSAYRFCFLARRAILRISAFPQGFAPLVFPLFGVRFAISFRKDFRRFDVISRFLKKSQRNHFSCDDSYSILGDWNQTSRIRLFRNYFFSFRSLRNSFGNRHILTCQETAHSSAIFLKMQCVEMYMSQ